MEKPLPYHELLSGLQNLYEEKYMKNMPNSVTSAVNKIVSYAKNSEEAALK